MNKQEIFDRGVAGILKQGEPAIDPRRNLCKYRDDQGHACFVGKLIPDEIYTPELEAEALSDVVALIKADEHYDLLAECQEAHDTAAIIVHGDPGSPNAQIFSGTEFIARFKENVAEIADRYGLSKEVLRG
jgi:hypothetical protein